MVLSAIRAWFRRTFQSAPPIDDSRWDAALRSVGAARHLNTSEHATLRQLVTAFLHEKEFVPVEGFDLQAKHRDSIAVAACIPILHLGIEAYRKFQSIYVFPAVFRASGAQAWRPGSLHGAIAGLAVQGGGVALAWTEALEGNRDGRDGQNTIIHEFAHKLDMLDGAADGRPPLPDGVSQKDWFDAFATAFADFQKRVRTKRRTRLDSYGATNPAEFFAVLSEVYFEDPKTLRKEYPDVHRMLRAFYTQKAPD